MNYKGKLIRWNEDRGFGFIKSDASNKEVFIHISALKQTSRKPLVGDLIHFDLVEGKDGKTRAENARIEGVTQINRARRKRSNKIYIFALLAMVILCSYFFKFFMAGSGSSQILNVKIDSVGNVSNFSCQGKQYCRQMNSCAEAIFYLKNCPNVNIDGDNDGIPCETQWCD
jgi:cold shock CspA family protein